MKRPFIYAFSALVIIILVASCAKESELPFQQMQQTSFSDWITKNAPQAVPFIDKEGNKYQDIYVQYYKRGQDVFPANRLKIYDWFYLDYTGYNLAADIFATRDSTTARMLGTWKNTTHWCSDFLQFVPENYSLSSALLKVAETLNPQDELRLYFSGYQGFPNGFMTINAGYDNPNTEYSAFPVYMDIKMGEIVKNPADAEVDSVNRYAKNKWDLTINDTIIKGMYIRKTRQMPSGYDITEDTSVQIYYTQRFLDNFMIKTNNDSVAKAEGRYVESGGGASDAEQVNYNVLQFTPNKKDSPISIVLNRAVLNMKKGEIADVVTISTWTDQGNAGTFGTKPQVLPFQPTIFTIRILMDNEEVTEDL